MVVRKYPWFKSWDDELEDPKVEDLSDSEYRVWRTCMNLCNRSPARLRERGYLYHSQGYPVTSDYIARRLRKSIEEVQAALARLCESGGESPLILLEDDKGNTVYRIRAWRKRQRDDCPDEETPQKSQESPTKLPGTSPIREEEEKKKKERKKKKPPPRPTWAAESQVLNIIDGYPFSEEKDRALMDALAEAYTQLDLAQELRKMKAWLVTNDKLPLQGQAGPRKRVRAWMQRADAGYGQNQRPGPSGRRQSPSPASDFKQTGEVEL